MDLGLKGKVVAVTGGSEGIGRATALRFAMEGANVALLARRAEPLAKTASEIEALGVQVLAVTGDATKDMPRFIEETVKRFGRIDALVNNAGGSGQNARNPTSKTTSRAPKLTIVLMPRSPVQCPSIRSNLRSHLGHRSSIENQRRKRCPWPHTGHRLRHPRIKTRFFDDTLRTSWLGRRG